MPSGPAIGSARPLPSAPAPFAVPELLKPVPWFPPVWAFGCGIVSSGAPLSERWPLAFAGLLLAGPVVCGMSQAVNDWFDRHVGAVNEPGRPIPSGRIPGRWGPWIALGWTALSLMLGLSLGSWAAGATAVGVALAWAYSAPPLRLKRDGWWGNTAVAACYEGLPRITGAAVMAGAAPDGRVPLVAALFSAGAHGIMTLDDSKSVKGDRRFGIGSLPVRLGPERVARVACAAMAAPQAAVVALLFGWGAPWQAGAVLLLLLAQLTLMARLLRDPRASAPWYNATGVTLHVLGMLVCAFALRPGAAAAAGWG